MTTSAEIKEAIEATTIAAASNDGHAPVWRPGWFGDATIRIRFPDGVAFYNGVPKCQGWIGMNMADEFMEKTRGGFSEHPGLYDALWFAFHTMSLDDVLERIRARYGPTVRPLIEFKANTTSQHQRGEAA